MGRVKSSIVINAPPSKVFEYISDLTRFPDFIYGVTEVIPLDEKRSRWKAEAFGVPLYWSSEFKTWKKDEEISWESYEGIKNNGSWRLEEVKGGTRLDFYMEYEVPKSTGVLGALLDQAILVNEFERRVSQGLQKIKELVERE
jgi:uncharacterized membrane protein